MRLARRYSVISKGFRNSSFRISPGCTGGNRRGLFDLVVVGDFDFICIAFLPVKAHAPLIVDTDAVLAGAIAPKLLKSIAWRNHEVLQVLGRIDHQELAGGRSLNLGGPSPDRNAFPYLFGIPVGEGANHVAYSNARHYGWQGHKVTRAVTAVL